MTRCCVDTRGAGKCDIKIASEMRGPGGRKEQIYIFNDDEPMTRVMGDKMSLNAKMHD